MIEKTDWEVFAVNMLKAELKRKGVTYAQLAEMIGGKEVNIRNKLARKVYRVVPVAEPIGYRDA